MITAAHAGGRELLGRDPVEVEVVDDRDLSGPRRLTRSLVLRPEARSASIGRRRAAPKAGRTGRRGRRARGRGESWLRHTGACVRASDRVTVGAQAASSSSRACRLAVSSAVVGAEHPDDLGRPLLALDVLDRGPASPLTTSFAIRKCLAASEATWGRWVMQRTWRSGAEPLQPLADRARGLAADAGVDLVEDEGRRAAPAARARRARASPARAPRPSGVAQRRNRHARDSSRGGTRPARGRTRRSRPDAAPAATSSLAPRHRELRELLGNALELAGRLRRAPRSASPASPPAARKRAPAPRQLGAALLGALEPLDLRAGSDRRGQAPARPSRRACASAGRATPGAPRPAAAGPARHRSPSA